jgi:hypothetical protein
MACERFRDALADVAAGAPAPVGVEAHLASCEACRAELRALRQALAVADAETALLASAEPSPELPARIRRAVAESEPSPAWRFGWLWPAVAAAATVLVALAVVIERGTRPAPGPRVAVGAPPAHPTGRPRAWESVDRPEEGPVTPRSSVQVERRGVGSPAGGSLLAGQNDARRDDNAPARSRSAGRRAIPAEPEVLVPPGETDALLRFVALVHRDRLVPPVLSAAGQASADLAEPAPIDIKPLEIVPLDPAETSGT